MHCKVTQLTKEIIVILTGLLLAYKNGLVLTDEAHVKELNLKQMWSRSNGFLTFCSMNFPYGLLLFSSDSIWWKEHCAFHLQQVLYSENQLFSLFQVCNVFLKASFFFMIKPRAQNPDWLGFLFSTGQHIQIQPTRCLRTSKFKTWNTTLFWYSKTPILVNSLIWYSVSQGISLRKH